MALKKLLDFSMRLEYIEKYYRKACKENFLGIRDVFVNPRKNTKVSLSLLQTICNKFESNFSKFCHLKFPVRYQDCHKSDKQKMPLPHRQQRKKQQTDSNHRQF